MNAETLTQWLALAGLFLAVSTPVARALQGAARRLEEYAYSTPSRDDDEWAIRLRETADGLVGVLDLIGAIIPRITMSGREDGPK